MRYGICKLAVVPMRKEASHESELVSELLFNDIYEVIDENEPLELFDPQDTWKRKVVTNYEARELLVPIFKNGECVYNSPDIKAIQGYCRDQVETLWEEVRRFENPHRYYVDLSQKLWDIKMGLLAEHGARKK